MRRPPSGARISWFLDAIGHTPQMMLARLAQRPAGQPPYRGRRLVLGVAAAMFRQIQRKSRASGCTIGGGQPAAGGVAGASVIKDIDTWGFAKDVIEESMPAGDRRFLPVRPCKQLSPAREG